MSSTRVSSDADNLQPSRIVCALSRHVFYGWVVVAMAFIAQMFSGLSIQGMATYMVPLEREFGWSRAVIAGGRTFQQVDAFLGPLNGWLVDRYGARRLMSLGVVLFAIAFVALSAIESVWAYYGACLLLAVANTLLGLLVVGYSVNQWFRRKRTTAMGIAVTGFAVSGMVLIPAMVWAQTELGWRTAALLTGGVLLLLGLPIMLLIRDSPEPYGLLPDGDRVDAGAASGRQALHGGGLVNFTLAEALRTRAYWYLNLGMVLSMLAQVAVVVHQFAHFEDVIDRESAALVLVVLNVFNMAGRLFGGILGDRMSKHHLLGVSLVVTTGSLVVAAYAASLPLLMVYGALFGFCWGIRTPVINSLLGDYFGRLSYGRIAGLTFTFSTPLAMISPIIVGLVVDMQGNYQHSLLVLALVTAISATLFFLARRPPDPVRLSSSGNASPTTASGAAHT